MCDRWRDVAVPISGVLLMLALIWFSVWLGGPQDCTKVVDVRIGGMLAAGCDRR